MNNIREHLFLSALLHDIGKFYQRADFSLSEKMKEKDFQRYANIIEYLCPLTEKGNFGYQHSIWTYGFIDEIGDIIKGIPGFEKDPFNDKEESLLKLACYHHKPSSELEALISMADWWSAGMNRCDAPKTLEVDTAPFNEPIKWGKERNKQIPLYSIFNGIHKGKYKNAFKLKPLSLIENDCFPQTIEDTENGNNQESYKKLWDDFRKEIKQLPNGSFIGFTESLLYLLKKYTSGIPTNTIDMTNVSLYDHLKTTAAFTDCLSCYKEEHPEDFTWDGVKKRLNIKEEVYPVLLVGGDLSGIQKFIYNIASRKAAVSLKGRSFYLQLLIDSLIQRIINHPDIDATIAQIVYSSGGKFYMLLPNTTKVKEALQTIKKEIETELWDKHKGQLMINIDYVPFAYSHNDRQINIQGEETHTIGDLWKCLADKLTTCKNQKFHHLIIERFDEMFEPQKCNEKTKVCAVTGIESDKLVALDEKEDEKTYVLPIVKQQAQLGNWLKDADSILTYNTAKDSQPMQKELKESIEIANTHNYLFNHKDITESALNFSADRLRIKRINDVDFLRNKMKGQNNSYAFQFYGGNQQAQIKFGDKERNKTFDELSDGTYLGILRMDVDNLGALFIKGLPDEDKSFSAYSTLSSMLDYFFSGYLNTIRGKEDFKKDVNILYSGGDDVFAIGRWNKLISFAAQLRKEFEKFVGRSDISISGGIVMVGGKYPLSKAAQQAGDAEDDAKKFQKENGEKKNALNIFGQNISWNNEYDYVLQWKDNFVKHCNDNMPRSILHRIMNLGLVVIKNKATKNKDYSYMWHTSYFLTRFSENKKEEIKDFCKNLSKELINERKYELITIAARWAELELKENNN